MEGMLIYAYFDISIVEFLEELFKIYPLNQDHHESCSYHDNNLHRTIEDDCPFLQSEQLSIGATFHIKKGLGQVGVS